MSESILPEYCSVCGGVTGPHAREKVVALNVVGHLRHVCPGHTDGQLDENYRVCRGDGTLGFKGVALEYKGTTQALIHPRAALFLLAWLKQEEADLERLAREGE